MDAKAKANKTLSKAFPFLFRMRFRGTKHQNKLIRRGGGVKLYHNKQEGFCAGSSYTHVLIVGLKLTVEQPTAPNTPTSHSQYCGGGRKLMRQMAYSDIAELWSARQC